jgi:phosphohistidine swiveling domain-containing protein
MVRAFPEFGYNPVTGEWNDSLKGDYLWSNVNVSEAVPDVMTPSTWSLWWIYHYEVSPFEFPGDHPMCGNICGRPYLNLGLLGSIYRALGRDVRQEMQGDMVCSAPADLDIPNIPFSPLAVLWKGLPAIFKARQDARRDLKQLPEFLGVNPGWCRTMQTHIQDCAAAPDLLSIWMKAIRPTVVRALRLLRSVTMTMADPVTKLRLDLTALVGEVDTNALLSNFSGASGDLESLGPLVGLARLQNGRMSREQYMERYGHRGPHEMELLASDADDDPAWFEKQLADFTQAATDVDTLLVTQRAECASAWQRFKTRFPNKLQTTRQKLDMVATAAKNREAVRSEVTRLARLVRQFLLRAGILTGLDDDIFFLSLDEMTALLAGDKSSLSRIPARRGMYQRYCALPPYPAIIYGRFDPFQWAEDPNRRSDFYDARQIGAAAPSPVIKGFAGAAGCVEGIVRRIDRVGDGNQIQPGEILVTTVTNVGWTPLFPRLAAIVTDVGAPLSHAAIVARELGIPAVVGCGNATMLLKTGDRIRVDGGAGTVILKAQ